MRLPARLFADGRFLAAPGRARAPSLQLRVGELRRRTRELRQATGRLEELLRVRVASGEVVSPQEAAKHFAVLRCAGGGQGRGSARRFAAAHG